MQFVRRVAPLLALLVALGDRAAIAQPIDDATRAAARDLGYAGVEAYQTGNYAAASEKFEKAYRIVRTPTLGLWSARALVRLGKYVEAFERYQEVTLLETVGTGQAVLKQAQADAAGELAALKPRIPSLVVRLEGVAAGDGKITIDGALLAAELVGEARPVNPGHHQIVLERRGERMVTDVAVADGERKLATIGFPVLVRAGGVSAGADLGAGEALRVTKASGDDSVRARLRTYGWIAAGVGGAGLALGGVTWLVANGMKNDLDPQCHPRCPSSSGSQVESYNSLRMIPVVASGAGAVLVTTGVVLVLTSSSSRSSNTAIWASPAAVGVAGRF